MLSAYTDILYVVSEINGKLSLATVRGEFRTTTVHINRQLKQQLTFYVFAKR